MAARDLAQAGRTNIGVARDGQRVLGTSRAGDGLGSRQDLTEKSTGSMPGQSQWRHLQDDAYR
jgi:hypothetical protein